MSFGLRRCRSRGHSCALTRPRAAPSAAALSVPASRLGAGRVEPFPGSPRRSWALRPVARSPPLLQRILSGLPLSGCQASRDASCQRRCRRRRTSTWRGHRDEATSIRKRRTKKLRNTKINIRFYLSLSTLPSLEGHATQPSIAQCALHLASPAPTDRPVLDMVCYILGHTPTGFSCIDNVIA